MIHHPVFIRNLGEKSIVCTIVDSAEIGAMEGDSFVMGTTGPDLYAGMDISMRLATKQGMSSKDWGDTIGEPSTIGMGISGVLTTPYWFIKKVIDPIMSMLGV